DLTHCQRKKLAEGDFDDRVQTEHAGANGATDHGRFTDRSLANARRTKLFEEPFRAAHRSAEFPDVLADEENTLITTHFVGDRRNDRLNVSQAGHVAYTWS